IPRPEEMILELGVAYAPFEVNTLNWTWKVQAPHFVVAPSGVLFRGFLSVSDGSSTVLQAFERPVTVGVQAGNTETVLSLDVASAPIQVFWRIANRTIQIGNVNVAPFFSTALHVRQWSFYVAGRTLTGSITNVGVQYLTGSIQLTGDV